MEDFSITWLRSLFELESVSIGLTRADANGLVDRVDEDFSVSDLAGLCCPGDRSDHLLDLISCDRDLDLQLRQKVHGVFGTAIDFRMSLLSSVAFDLGNGQSVNADAGEGVTHLLQLERLDDGHDDLHVAPVPALALRRRMPRLGVIDRARHARLKNSPRMPSQCSMSQIPC